MWRPIIDAPFAQDIELAVIDDEGVHALVFPCQRMSGAWVDARTGDELDVHPTHWRGWLVEEVYATDRRRGTRH
ncbi:hypothetical protein Rleg4DRAFT_2732 [Rhizobium leguminosarum bv. trifolii WSM2297]|uniref:Uncharacterized protein n=1 Tax=Rhizobium leguminosarum bv. trifolii WSM2297 TaxID=754762 RepID=J0CCY8_RHILT|nr:hypothetical protein [Rhizobium leguminosarum]EJC81062.1 hypothetical protein Rleg4DRAFT_2732 [Rhizobium leguminosarum bv. trifolii WSM2297]